MSDNDIPSPDWHQIRFDVWREKKKERLVKEAKEKKVKEAKEKIEKELRDLESISKFHRKQENDFVIGMTALFVMLFFGLLGCLH